MFSALHTDLYQLTMAQARFLAGGQQPRASFSLTFRSNPYQGGFAVCAGLGRAIEYLESWHFSDEDIAYLRALDAYDGTPLFKPAFLDELARARFTCDVDAVPEGRLVFAGAPILRVTGPVSQAQLVETPLLNIINFSTLIATKALRCVMAADGDDVFEFGLRRAQGPDGGLMASRAAYVGGVNATSSTLAGRLWGIPVAGTHAHSWIMSHASEIDAFRAYVETSPNNAILLVDTYDTLRGVANAIVVAREMEARGHRLRGIRIDSGDLAWLSRQARRMLDEAGLGYIEIVASNSLDEYTVASLKDQGAEIDIWGIGTAMVTGGEQSALDGVYKMTAIQDADGAWRSRMKISDQIAKATLPGIHQVRRFFGADGTMIGDMIYCENVTLSASDRNAPGKDYVMVDVADVTRTKRFSAELACEDLLVPVMREASAIDGVASTTGGLLGGSSDEVDLAENSRANLAQLEQARERLAEDVARLDDSHKRFLRPHVYPVGIEESLSDERLALMKRLRGEDADAPAPADVITDVSYEEVDW